MHPRNVLCVVLFCVAYVLLIPGLTCLLFSAKAEVHMGGMVIPLVDIEKSTIGAIHMLFENGKWPAAITILVCSVLAPFFKLAVLLVCVYSMKVQGNTGPSVCSAITAVRRISKWATVDAFTASILVAFFVSNPILHVDLHKGYYCFVGYCIFSVAGALVLEKPASLQSATEAFEEQQRLVSSNSSPHKSLRPAIAGAVVLSGLLVTLTFMPLFEVDCALLSLHERLSFVMIVQRLLEFGSRVAALLCIACVGLIPAADILCTLVEASMGRTLHPVGEWLQDFAMFEVFALAIVVTQNASAGVNSNLTVKVLPGGWLFVTCGALWLLYSLLRRVQKMSFPTLSKDKLGAGSFASA